MAATSQAVPSSRDFGDYKLPFVIAASSVGTIIEWYDFYLYAVLTAFLAPLFFPSDNPTTSLLAGFATFGAGFAVRPFGAVVFGHIGDLVGRKYAFLITVTIMGLGTTVIGLLPGYAQIGVLAPTILVLLRLAQGLALGGEYGGAAIYVAEHSPDNRRGFFTAWIQTTATVGLVLALIVILICRLNFGAATFADWGWRVPFLLSALLVAIALYIRVRLRETPLFSRLKAAGNASTNPTRDSLGNARNWRLIALALFGATAGQAVVWYQGQFQSRSYLEGTLKVDFVTGDLIMIGALLLGTPFFLVFGALSDRIGRKPIIMAGCLLAAVTYYPIYLLMGQFTQNPLMEGVLIWIQMIYVTMVYGPIAAFLVEFFPARIRYTSLSIPYHLGNGEFGGWLPFIATAIAAATGNPLLALIYPIAIALVTFVVGTLLIKETRGVRIWDEVGGDVSEVPAPTPTATRPATVI
ncbi:MAG: MHS family MFS transporter [Chloroflexota bacterium]|nr:MHS family MFS transporter [Chloroflexota bacterium]